MDAPERDSALEAQLRRAMGSCCIGGAIQAYASCPSTMDLARFLACAGVGEGALVWSRRQTDGRGRQGRSWESPDGGAYFSVILRPARAASDTPQLALVAGLACAEAIRETTGLFPSIRWPNDVLIQEKKVAGMLAETGAQDAGVSSQQSEVRNSPYVVVGVGINVTTDPAQLPDTATSLAACGASCDPCQLTAAFCRQLDAWYERWTAQGFEPIRRMLRPRLAFLGQVVRLTMGTDTLDAVAQDLDEAGRLVVRLDSGILRPFEAGEVQLLRGA